MFLRLKRTRGVEYLQLVANQRRGQQVQQKVLASLGRLDELRANGSLDQLVKAGAAFGSRAYSSDQTIETESIRLEHDITLPLRLLAALESRQHIGDIVAAISQPDPIGLRRLIADIAFLGLAKGVARKGGLNMLRLLGSDASAAARDHGISIMTLARGVPKIEGSRIVLGVRGGSATQGRPSFTRGLATFLARTEAGRPIAAGHWYAHLPSLPTLHNVVGKITEVFDRSRTIAVLDRQFSSRAILPHLQSVGAGFIVPIREGHRRGGHEDMGSWSCYETRPPRDESGMEGPPLPPGLRFLQLVDPVAAEMDWRLRELELDRIEKSAAGQVSPRAAMQLRAMQKSVQDHERWDGVTLLATNLRETPQEVARLYGMADSARGWEAEMSAFGRLLLESGVVAREAAQLLEGATAALLVACLCRNEALGAVNRKAGASRSWDWLTMAVGDHRLIRMASANRSAVVSPGGPTPLNELIEALGVAAPGTIDQDDAADPDEREDEDA